MTYATRIDAAAEAEIHRLCLGAPLPLQRRNRRWHRNCRWDRIARLATYTDRAYHGPRWR